MPAAAHDQPDCHPVVAHEILDNQQRSHWEIAVEDPEPGESWEAVPKDAAISVRNDRGERQIACFVGNSIVRLTSR